MENEFTGQAIETATARVWSQFQTAIFDFVRNGTGHLIVIARAGSGKTTTIVEACACCGDDASVLFVAFNKSIADELATRVPGNTTACTLHSLGFRAIKSTWGRGTQVDKDRERKMAEKLLPRDHYKMIAPLLKLVSMAKAWLVEDTDGLLELADAYQCTGNGTYNPSEWTGLVQDILRQSKERGTVSFDDMVWLPVVLSMRIRNEDGGSYTDVFVDETQDLNRSQVELVLRAANGGRIIAVGDDRQAIYAFRGADSASIERLTERLGATVKPLSITYRCPLTVVELAQKFVPDLQAADNAPLGAVAKSHFNIPFTSQPGDAVISRTNAPLVRLCLATLRAGKRAAIRGRDIGAGLSALVRKAKCDSIIEFASWLAAYAAKEAERLLNANKEEKVDELRDRVETLTVLSEGMASTGELLNRIESLFDDSTNNDDRVLFTSTHKAKGLEWNRVWMLHDTYRAMTAVRGGRVQPTREDENLAYVAITRAKQELFLVTGEK